MNITLNQLQALDAVVTQGSIQSGAQFLNKTHPSVINALKKLEGELNFLVFDRAGYRTTLTKEGRAFYLGAQRILGNVSELELLSTHLENKKETELNIVIGDITPLGDSLPVLKAFSDSHPFTRSHLLFDNLGGVNERLFNGQADVIIHHIDKSGIRYEYKDFYKVDVIPVVAPNFLDVNTSINLSYLDLSQYTQCIIRGTTEKRDTKSYFLSEHSPKISVGDQQTKKEIIKQGMAWGHMPLFMIESELERGELISLVGNKIKSYSIDLVVARLRNDHHGIVAEKLWSMF